MKLCDLHTHSIFSDGTYTPKELLTSAKEIGLSAIALCDHNTVDGLPDFLSAARDIQIEAIPGAEFSVDYWGKELHLLGLFIPEKLFSHVTQLMEAVMERKMQSNLQLIHALNAAGYEIDYDTIKNATPNHKFNRAHIAAELTKKGYTASVKEAFQRLLSPSAGYYQEPERISVWEMLDFIVEIGAVPVLAHPFLNLNEAELLEFLPLAMLHGLAGMECYYSTYDQETTEKSLYLADRFGLKYSGGSDFHGSNKPDIQLGTGKGSLQVPYAWAAELKSAR
ncbi:MAG: PHP domain-containing protein [Ruminococcaceae bacterium]|nr:PHP domain-containing protein [Oscillospiraceae bacterium]